MAIQPSAKESDIEMPIGAVGGAVCADLFTGFATTSNPTILKILILLCFFSHSAGHRGSPTRCEACLENAWACSCRVQTEPSWQRGQRRCVVCGA